MKKTYCLEVSGDFACFTRPETKVERVSYDVMTPSSARAVFESILWKPAIRWHVSKIEVLKPIRWVSIRRNEVAKVVSADNAKSAMKKGSGDLGIYIEDEGIRQQRAGLFLRDVAYRMRSSTANSLSSRYGLYVAHGFVSAHLASQTGFGRDGG